MQMFEAKALCQAQLVKQEFKQQIVTGYRLQLLVHLVGAGVFDVIAGMPVTTVTHNFGARELAVGTGADTQVIAKPPVIQVMPTFFPRPGKSRYLVTGIALSAQ